MDEFACVTITGRPGESEAEFKARLVAFWSHYLRTRPDDYERVYAEASAFEADGGTVTRQYLVGVEAVPPLAAELAAQGVGCAPVDADDLYSKYEATSPDWFQIEH